MREGINTDQAPSPLGPYAQANKVRCGEVVYCSGQTGLDPASGELVGESAASQAKQVMENLKAVLAAAGTDFGCVVKTTIFLTDMNDFGAVNEVYGEYFPANPPARTTVAVRDLPKGGLVEIDAIAVL